MMLLFSRSMDAVFGHGTRVGLRIETVERIGVKRGRSLHQLAACILHQNRSSQLEACSLSSVILHNSVEVMVMLHA